MSDLHSVVYRALRGLFVSTPVASKVDLRGKHIIITGASPGSIGFATAQTLAAWGARVIITTRSNIEDAIVALRVASGGEVHGHVMDLTDAASVKAFADWYVKTQGEQLDVLINNAGIHLDLRSQWKSPRLTADGFEIHWRTNYLGTSQLTHLLLPLLCKTAQHRGEARVVNVVSMLHVRGNNAGLFQSPASYNSWVAYGLSKLALMHATFEIQRRYGAQKVRAYCLHPGAVFTNIADKGLEGHPVLSAVRKKLAALERFFLLTPEEGAQTHIYCATHPELAAGLYYVKCRPAKACEDSTDKPVSARLWETTQRWCENPLSLCRWHVVANASAWRQTAIEMILSGAAQAIQQRGQFHLVLAGGTTPLSIYSALRTAKTDWLAWHIYFGDERCLPPTDPARNSRMAAECWLDHVPIPEAQVQVIPAEQGAVEAARCYGASLRARGDFDMVLLGLGEDGHTASLFPGGEWGTAGDGPDVLAVLDAPKPPAQRVSLSAARLSRARQVIFLVSGESKRQALSQWRAGDNIPARAITPAAGVDILVESVLMKEGEPQCS